MVGELTVNVDDSGAEVFIDASSEGISPLSGPVYVAPGSHTVEARKGGKTVSAQINAVAGRQQNATLTFQPKAAPPKAAPLPVPPPSEEPATPPPPPPEEPSAPAGIERRGASRSSRGSSVRPWA